MKQLHALLPNLPFAGLVGGLGSRIWGWGSLCPKLPRVQGIHWEILGGKACLLGGAPLGALGSLVSACSGWLVAKGQDFGDGHPDDSRPQGCKEPPRITLGAISCLLDGAPLGDFGEKLLPRAISWPRVGSFRLGPQEQKCSPRQVVLGRTKDLCVWPWQGCQPPK